MRPLITIFFFLITLSSVAQSNKPEYVIIIDGELATDADVEYYAERGRIKSMNKGVNDAQYEELLKKYGEDIGDKMFIMLISLHPEESYGTTRPSQLKETATEPLKNFKYQCGDKPEDFEIDLIDGSKLSLSGLEGKVVLINFWATWCAPCIMELYEVPEVILKPYQDKDFVFLPISIGESKARVASMMTKLNTDGIEFNSGLDYNKDVFKQFAKGSIPKSVVLDQEGRIQLMTEGNPVGNLDLLSDKIAELLNQANKE